MALIENLKSIVGDAFVLTGSDIGGYAHDWSDNYQWTPICVVRPANTDEVSAVLGATYAAGASVVPIAGNTSASGGGVADGAVMVSVDRLNDISDINPLRHTATCGAGVIVENIHTAVGEHDLVFPLVFGAQGTAMIGGALSTNAGGSNVIRYGNARALCLGIEVVLPDGRVMDLMTSLHKDNSGYDLRDLVIGAEGTLGIITRAVLKLFPRPKAYVTAMLACDSLEQSLEILPSVQSASGNGTEAYEYMSDFYIQSHIDRFPGAREPFEKRYPVNILLQVAATSDHDAEPDETGAIPLAEKIEQCLADQMAHGRLQDAVIARSDQQVREIWARREAAAELALAIKPYVGGDIAVPPDLMPGFITRADRAVQDVDPGCEVFTVAHLGDGNIHYTVRITDAAKYDPVTEAIEEIVKDLNGSFSAEHGIGIAKLKSMARRKDPVAIDVMRAIKKSLDPKGLMNPGKVIP